MAGKCCNNSVSTKIIKTTFKLRRGTSEAWERVNPILADGEPGFEIDTNVLKIGNGSTPYNELPVIGNCSKIADDKSIVLEDGTIFELRGFNEAEVGQIPVKGEDGNLMWVDKIETEVEVEAIPELDIRRICV